LNAYAQGHDEYPTDLNAAYSLLINYRTPVNMRARTPNTHQPNNNSDTSGGSSEVSTITFAQQGAVAGSNGLMHDGITCYACNNVGHYAVHSPEDQAASTTQRHTLTQYANMMTQANGQELNPNWILLDSQSTISVSTMLPY
jgi:hypothetical protein